MERDRSPAVVESDAPCWLGRAADADRRHVVLPSGRGADAQAVAGVNLEPSSSDGRGQRVAAGASASDRSWRRARQLAGPVVRSGRRRSLPPWPAGGIVAGHGVDRRAAWPAGRALDGSDFEPRTPRLWRSRADRRPGQRRRVSSVSPPSPGTSWPPPAAAGELGTPCRSCLPRDGRLRALERRTPPCCRRAYPPGLGRGHRLRRCGGLRLATRSRSRPQRRLDHDRRYALTPLLLHRRGDRRRAALLPASRGRWSRHHVDGAPTPCVVTRRSRSSRRVHVIAGVQTGRARCLVPTNPPIGGAGRAAALPAVDRAKGSPRPAAAVIRRARSSWTPCRAAARHDLVCCPPRATPPRRPVSRSPRLAATRCGFQRHQHARRHIRHSGEEQPGRRPCTRGRSGDRRVTDVEESTVPHVSEPTVLLRVRAEGADVRTPTGSTLCARLRRCFVHDARWPAGASDEPRRRCDFLMSTHAANQCDSRYRKSVRSRRLMYAARARRASARTAQQHGRLTTWGPWTSRRSRRGGRIGPACTAAARACSSPMAMSSPCGWWR